MRTYFDFIAKVENLDDRPLSHGGQDATNENFQYLRLVEI